MKKILILIGMAFFIANESKAQNNQIDSLTFSTEKGLLIFEGYLNGVKTDFAFDTGAGVGVLNNTIIPNAKIEIKGTRKINDSQKKTAKLDNAKIANLKIGSYNFPDLTSVVADMPFLYCNKTYLLGGDIINLLNWMFDFQKNIVYFSKTPFAPQSNMRQMPFKIIGNRHFSNLVIQGTPLDSVLIDFGYAGNCTLDAAVKSTKQIIAKVSPDNIYQSKSSSMGINSMSVGKETKAFFVDSVIFGGVAFNNFKINALASTHNKIGLLFFKKNFNQMILNNTELSYWLLPNNITPQKPTSFDAGFYFNDNRKIEVVSVNGSLNHTAKTLGIGETIKELNGRSPKSFADKCEFLAWYAEQIKQQELSVTKDSGERLIIKKSIF